MDSEQESVVERFLDAYKRLEVAIRSEFAVDEGESAVYKLRGMRGFSRYAEQLDCCREVRNLIQHTPRFEGAYPIAPDERMVTFLNKMTGRVRKRPRVIDIAVRGSKIVSCTPADGVSEVVASMYEQGRSHVPILESGHVVGVFDKDSVFTYLAERGMAEQPTAVRMAQLGKYVALDGRRSEAFTFHARDQFVAEAEELFDKQRAEGKDVALAFVTEHGKPEERILGLFTAWDIFHARA